MKAILLLVVLAIASVSAVSSVKELKNMVSLRSTQEFQACHGNSAALDQTMDEMFSLNDRVTAVHQFFYTPDSVLLQLGASKESIAAFRKATADWSFPTWEDVKKKVTQAGADAAAWVTQAINKKLDQIKDAWATAKQIAKDIWNGNWCNLCATTTTKLGDYIVGKLELEAPTLKGLACKLAEFLFDKACVAAFTAITASATATLTLGGATVLSGKVADGICWVLDKLNAVACDKFYGDKIANKLKEKIPALAKAENAVTKATDAINAAVKSFIGEFTGNKGIICKDGLQVCDANGNEKF